MSDIEVLFDAGVFLESPRWHDGAFWFSDIGGGKVRRIANGAVDVVTDAIPAPSGLGWTTAGEMLVASLATSSIHKVAADGTVGIAAGREVHGTPGTNDMATADGRSYVSCAGRDHQAGDDVAALAQPVGAILLYDHETGACRRVADALKMPNGLAIAPDGGTLIAAELYAMRILHFPILPDGALGEPRVFAELPHIADGICLDAEGGLWIGTGFDYFQRLDAAGQPAERVQVPGWSCVAPMLGGSDGRTLFGAANRMASPDDIFTGKAQGRIVATRVDVCAAPAATFS